MPKKIEAAEWVRESRIAQSVLTPIQAINLQSLLHLSNNKVNNMRTCLNNLNMNFWPSQGKMRKAKDPLVTHVKPDAIETDMMMMFKKKADVELTSCHVEQFSFDGCFDNKWWLLFGGDKGGQHMKFHVEILNSQNVGSEKNVHVYCLFESYDSYKNMCKVWITYRNQV